MSGAGPGAARRTLGDAAAGRGHPVGGLGRGAAGDAGCGGCGRGPGGDVAAPPASAAVAHRTSSRSVAFGRWVRLDKDALFEICDALATGETELARLGRPAAAAALTRAFALAEGGLAAGAVPRGRVAQAGEAGSSGVKSRAREFTQ